MVFVSEFHHFLPFQSFGISVSTLFYIRFNFIQQQIIMKLNGITDKMNYIMVLILKKSSFSLVHTKNSDFRMNEHRFIYFFSFVNKSHFTCHMRI